MTKREYSRNIIPKVWVAVNLKPDSPYYNALLSPGAQHRLRVGAQIPIPDFTSSNLEKQLEFVRHGKLFVDRRCDLIDLSNVDWKKNEHNFVSTQLHGLVGVGTLLRSQVRLPKEIEESITGHIRDWAHCVAEVRQHENPRAWNEGTVVKRQSNFLQALNYIRRHGELSGLDLTSLIYLIDTGVNYLLDTPRVYQRGNHGIRQDMMLAATALSLPEHPRANEMLGLAERRLNAAAREFFTKGGIWKEHAPGYVHYALRLMSNIMDLHKASDRFKPDMFIQRYRASRRFLLASLTPAGRIPYIGQAAADRVGNLVAKPATIERHLQRRAWTLAAFPDYGHAVLRGGHPNGLYLLFVAAQNLPAGKRDSADLSFILFNHLRPWITEGGHVTYEDSDVRNFTLSPMAHNTYILNGRYIPFDQRRDLLTRLTLAEERASGYRIAGFTERFDQNARFERTIDVDKDFGSITIRDSLHAETVETWEGRMHIPGDLEVLLEGNKIIAMDPATGTQMIMEFRSEAPLAFATCKGQEEPLCGWGQNPDGFGPVTSLIWTLRQNADVEIGITFRSGGR